MDLFFLYDTEFSFYPYVFNFSLGNIQWIS